MINIGRQQQQLIDVLKKARDEDRTGMGWVSKMYFISKLVPAITQHGARVNELREKGFVIESAYVNDNNWKYYRLIRDPRESNLPPAFDPPKIKKVIEQKEKLFEIRS